MFDRVILHLRWLHQQWNLLSLAIAVIEFSRSPRASQGTNLRSLRQAGLSTLSQSLLGRPLDKSLQVGSGCLHAARMYNATRQHCCDMLSVSFTADS